MAAPSLVEHGERLAHARAEAEIDAQHAALRAGCAARCLVSGSGVTRPFRRVRPLRAGVVEGEVQLQHIDPGVTEDPEGPVRRVFIDEGKDLVHVETTLGGDSRRLQLGVAHRDVRVEPGT